MMKWRCFGLIHGGEGPRGARIDIEDCNTPFEAAEAAAEYFDDCEQIKERCGHDGFDGGWQYIEVVAEDGKVTRHEVMCEVKRSYTSVVR